ncbi:MAG: cytochrome P460 family protein [Nitrosospira sp.]|nr:cytochrome P460 family protein [Nitrosospira sp.]MBI0410798.1 cytochrome P460 family protein [Nitrosospira sp.]MBI0411915.1 cytochrome P460 family protein [Nitrosospira sp.]
MKHIKSIITIGVVAITMVACSHIPPTPLVTSYKDGELPVPTGYESWPKFLSAVQRPEVKQVREIYINPIGHRTKMGESFPNGTLTVMEIYKALESSDGSPLKSSDGNFIKGELLKIAVMGKGAGWGDSVTPAELKNGDWIYSIYLADAKTTAPDNTGACRACHLPLTEKDYIFRYDEYFEKRAKQQ